MPSPLFTLDITIAPAHHVTLRLHDEHGIFLASSEHTLTNSLPSPTDLLGPTLLRHLASGIHHRTLLIRLPDPTTNPLSADLARIPWELARAPGDPLTLLDHNVVTRIALTGAGPTPDAPIAPDPTSPLRVLLVFAETPDARPLAARLERERLLDLFFRDVLPTRDVEIDLLTHGVTESRLRDRIRARGGYHLVHWSGHGQDDGLHVARDDGAPGTTRLSGADLAALFARAGGFVPHVLVLGACHSGSTRTALALLAAGVEQIVAMRDEVGDTYARRLARRFYRNLLADRAHHSVDAALALARRELADDTRRAADYRPEDHAMPVVFGHGTVRFEPRARRSAQASRQHPQPQPLPPALGKPAAFVGRGEALATLAGTWLAPGEAPIALVLGPAGIGKTALAAEALHLWFDRFDHALGFPVEGGALRAEEILQQIHRRLWTASPSYRQRCADNEAAAVYLPPAPPLTGPAREEALRDNLVHALAVERVLLVLDGLDASLLATAAAAGHEAQDPALDRLLATLADRLRGTGSRVLITSRRAPSALHAARCAGLELGLLPRAEAAVFLDADPVLCTLRRGGDPGGLLARLTEAGRGHPFVLAHLASVARRHAQRDGTLSVAGRVALADIAGRLAAEGFDALPALLPDPRAAPIAAGLVDLLIETVPFAARQLLGVLARGPDPRPATTIAPAWEDAGAQADLPASLDALLAAGLVRAQDGDMLAIGPLVAARAGSWMHAHPEASAGWPSRWTSAG